MTNHHHHHNNHHEENENDDISIQPTIQGVDLSAVNNEPTAMAERRVRRVCLYIDEDEDEMDMEMEMGNKGNKKAVYRRPPLIHFSPSSPYNNHNNNNSPPRALANPGPIGLLGFGMTTILLNVHNTGYYSLTTSIPAMGICFGGAAQLIAGLLEFTRGNTFAFVAFVSYGAFWLSLVCIWYLPNKNTNSALSASATDAYALGVYLLLWGIYTAVMFVGSIRSNIALMTVFGTLTVLFALLAAGNMGNSAMTLRVAGFEGIVCGASALYLAFAEVLNEVYGRIILPIGNMNKDKKAQARKRQENAPSEVEI